MQPTQKNRKRGILSTGLFAEQEKGSQKTNTVPMGPSRGYVAQKKGQGNYVTTALRPVMKNGAKLNRRRQKAENDSFAAYCNGSIPSW